MNRRELDRLTPGYMEKVDVRGKDDCWPFLGAKIPQGYGWYQGTTAHRFMYEMIHGPIRKKGMVVCHKCDYRICQNYGHLFLGTPQDNTDDMIRKGRGTQRLKGATLAQFHRDYAKAKRHPSGRLKNGELERIARKYGIKKSTVWYYANGRRHGGA